MERPHAQIWSGLFCLDDVLIYLSATRGFKSGGFNSETGVGEQFDPEFIWSYEAGIKSTFLKGLLQVNISAFYYDYKDLQVYRSLRNAPAVLAIENAAQAEMKGGEAEIIAYPVPGLELNVGVALLDAKFTEYTTLDPDAPDPTVERDLSGNTTPMAPKLSTFLGVQYDFPLMGLGDLLIRGEWKYQSRVFFDPFNNEGVQQAGYHLFNAHLQLDHIDGNWEFAIWAKNLTNTLYRQNVLRSTQFIGTLEHWGPPRTFGFQVAYLY